MAPPMLGMGLPGSFVLDGGPCGPGEDREAVSSLGSGDGREG